ncbi:hypothetical protein KFL_004470030 [Klebsormidium nitens]|uniref:F-box domain-containing protein n=1 Tax=Klebsormidium nitens TaxID=105231 RepID=A0A1Y1IKL7_KLENI|nr:hypothetical protein KFL_004470030 [Klebsormidium nitens]|eukprot:GAQ88638.1 hypothetical protein KFL_004470030 [Klebsormidium nitens]
MQVQIPRMADQGGYASADELDEELERAFEAPPKQPPASEQPQKDKSYGRGVTSFRTSDSSLGSRGAQESGYQTRQKPLLPEPPLAGVINSLDNPLTLAGRLSQSNEAADKGLGIAFATPAQVAESASTFNGVPKALGLNMAGVIHSPVSRQLAKPADTFGTGSSGLWTHDTTLSSLSEATAPAKTEITFQFPDWGVNFGKRGLDSTTGRGALQDAEKEIEAKSLWPGGRDAKEVPGCLISESEKGKGKGSLAKRGSSQSKERHLRPEEDPSLPAPVCVFHTLPEEVLLIIFKKLDAAKDVCSCILVCNRWEEILGGDEIWAGLLARRFPGREFAQGGARAEYKRGVMLMSIGERFQFLQKGFEFLVSALDAWWDSATPTNPALPYDQPTVRRIVGKLTASNWTLLYEGFAALFIARADKLAVDLLAVLASAQALATHPHRSPISTSVFSSPSILASPFKSPLRSPRNPTTPHSATDVSPSTADVTKRVATTLRRAKTSRNAEEVSGSFSDDLLESVGRGKRRRGGFTPTARFPTNQAVPLGELVARAESEPDGLGWGRGLRGLAEGGVDPDDVAEALAGGRELYGLNGDGIEGSDAMGWSMEQESAYGGGSSSGFGGKEALESRPKAGPAGAALWREVLRVWRRHRAFVLLVSEQCERLNTEVLRERARAHGVAATPTVFDQGALCFRGQILLRHRLRRPLQAGLAWLTLRALSGDATDDEYELLKEIRHMRQEIDNGRAVWNVGGPGESLANLRGVASRHLESLQPPLRKLQAVAMDYAPPCSRAS